MTDNSQYVEVFVTDDTYNKLSTIAARHKIGIPDLMAQILLDAAIAQTENKEIAEPQV